MASDPLYSSTARSYSPSIWAWKRGSKRRCASAIRSSGMAHFGRGAPAMSNRLVGHSVISLPDGPRLARPGLFPLHGGQVRSRALQVRSGVSHGPVFSVFDGIHGLGRRDPGLCVDVEHRRLESVRIVLGEKPQMLSVDFDFGPNSPG